MEGRALDEGAPHAGRVPPRSVVRVAQRKADARAHLQRQQLAIDRWSRGRPRRISAVSRDPPARAPVPRLAGSAGAAGPRYGFEDGVTAAGDSLKTFALDTRGDARVERIGSLDG